MKKNIITDKCVSIIQKLDYTLKTYEQREDLVKQIFNIEYIDELNSCMINDDFWIRLFESSSENGIDNSYVKVHLSQNDMLYTDSMIAKILETVGTYLLMADDVKEKTESNIKIYHEKELFDRIQKDKAKVQNLQHVEGEQPTLEIFVKQRNFNISTNIEITNTALKQSELLRSYMPTLNYLKNRNKTLSDGKTLTKEELDERRIVRQWISTINIDMELSYISEFRPIKFKSPLISESKIDWSEVDFFDNRTVRRLLNVVPDGDVGSDLSVILLDLDEYIQSISLTDSQQSILELYRNGMQITQIAEIKDCSKQYVDRILNAIVQKIVKEYEKRYKEWYYLNISKGKYVECKRCGNNKLEIMCNKSQICTDCAKK